MAIDRIGLSGVQAADISLHNTAHNIANAETPGFSRQQPVLTTEQSHRAGQQQQLAGVSVQCLFRLSDDFLADQVCLASASEARARVLAEKLNKLDNLLATDQTGLAAVLGDFIGDLQRAEARPESLPLRQQWLGTAGRLVSRFHALDQQLQILYQQRAQQMASLVTQTNRLTDHITRLNQQITELSGLNASHGSNHANLLDQRDELINQLAALTGIEVQREAHNSVSLFIPSDQGNLPLVAGQQRWLLNVAPGHPTRLEPQVLLQTPGIEVPLPAQLGALAGLQAVGPEGLLPVLNQLGLQSVLLAEGLNRQLTEGADINGNSGEPLFLAINRPEAMAQRVIPEAVAGTGQLAVEIDDLAELAPSDYQLHFTTADPAGNQCQVIRLSDGRVFNGVLNPEVPLTIDGLNIHLTGQPVISDRYLLTPWRHEARQLAVVLTDPAQLAFARRDSGPGDNRNLHELLGNLNGTCPGSRDLVNLYTRLQSSVANQTAAALQQQETGNALHQVAVAERESLSGVNLDEEAASLIRFQQFYQANARVLRVNQTIIDDLLAMFR